MANGKVSSYNAVNRVGYIKPEEGGPDVRFYLTSVSNAEPLPNVGDQVTYTAPEPRKSKRGKLVQENASSVTIEERAVAEAASNTATETEKSKPSLTRFDPIAYIEQLKSSKNDKEGKGRKGKKGRKGGKAAGRSERIPLGNGDEVWSLERGSGEKKFYCINILYPEMCHEMLFIKLVLILRSF